MSIPDRSSHPVSPAETPVGSTPNENSATRRELLRTAARTVSGAAITAAGLKILPALAQSASAPPRPAAIPKVVPPVPAKPVQAETVVKSLYHSLTPGQRETLCMPWEHTKRSMVQANWGIVKPTIGQTFTADQQAMVRDILRGLTTEEWYPKILEQMRNDAGGLENYYVALFGSPDEGKFEWVITGRHVTLRADGHSNRNAAFGGPIFYGHAVKETEDPAHPGNIYWQQAQGANKVYTALDGKQRERALLPTAPPEGKIDLSGAKSGLPGIALAELSRDQKALVSTVMRDLLSPYRPSDADAVMRDIAANGGMDALSLSFYKSDDLGSDGVWDIWRLEGPALVWHFRGAPHVHTWVNVAKSAKLSDAHT